MQPHHGDLRSRYCLRHEAQLRTLLEQAGQEESRCTDGGVVRPQRREVPEDKRCAGPLHSVRPAPRHLLELDGAVAGACFDEQRVSFVEDGSLPNPDRPGHKQHGNHGREASHIIRSR